jgi:hypothetical protein
MPCSNICLCGECFGIWLGDKWPTVRWPLTSGHCPLLVRVADRCVPASNQLLSPTIKWRRGGECVRERPTSPNDLVRVGVQIRLQVCSSSTRPHLEGHFVRFLLSTIFGSPQVSLPKTNICFVGFEPKRRTGHSASAAKQQSQYDC